MASFRWLEPSVLENRNTQLQPILTILGPYLREEKKPKTNFYIPQSRGIVSLRDLPNHRTHALSPYFTITFSSVWSFHESEK